MTTKKNIYYGICFLIIIQYILLYSIYYMIYIDYIAYLLDYIIALEVQWPNGAMQRVRLPKRKQSRKLVKVNENCKRARHGKAYRWAVGS